MLGNICYVIIISGLIINRDSLSGKYTALMITIMLVSIYISYVERKKMINGEPVNFMSSWGLLIINLTGIALGVYSFFN